MYRTCVQVENVLNSGHKFRTPNGSGHTFRTPNGSGHKFRTPNGSGHKFRTPNGSGHKFRTPNGSGHKFRTPNKSGQGEQMYHSYLMLSTKQGVLVSVRTSISEYEWLETNEQSVDK